MRIEILGIRSDYNVWATGLLVDGSSTYDNAATGTATLLDTDGGTVGGPYDFAYQAGTDGNYKATIPNTVSITDGTEYDVEVVMTGSGGQVRTMRRRVRAGYKG